MADCAVFNFVVWGIGGVVLCCFGYTGNLLSIIALQRDIRTPASTLLQSLAISDLVLLTCVCITDFVPWICDYTQSCWNIWKIWPQVRFLWFLIPMSHMCSIWLAVLIAANRYWAVCRPLHTASVWTNLRTCIYIACVVCGVVVFNVPRIFEYRIIPKTTDTLDSNATFAYTMTTQFNHQNETGNNSLTHSYLENSEQVNISLRNFEVLYEEETTEFGKRYDYRVVYKVILVNSLLILLPLGFLFLSSLWVIRSLHLTNSNSLAKKSRKMSSPGNSEDRKSNTSREVTFVLVTVVLVVVACQTPLAVFHFVRYLYNYTCGDVVFYLETISKFLVNLNACINFVIYCILGPRFRRLLILSITCTPKGKARGRYTSKSLAEGEMEKFKLSEK